MLEVSIRMVKLKSVLKYCLEAGAGMLSEHRLNDALRQAKVVSFDIFDTLVKRDLRTSEEIHNLVELEFFRETGIRIHDYVKRRVKAEESARKYSGKEEITLEDIFCFLEEIPDDWKKQIQKLEKELEVKICTPNLRVRSLYEKVIKKGKKVIITSDMYLDQKTVEQILFKCGYTGYEKLYLSSTYGACKNNASIYRIIERDYIDFKGNILHVGDQVKSDYIMARKEGINAVLIKEQIKSLNFWKRKNVQVSNQFLYQRLYAFLNNHMKDTDQKAYSIGWEILGPLLLGYCQWLHLKIREDEIEKIFFLSREGKLIQDAFNILYPHCEAEQVYLYGSRQALVVPQLADAVDFDEMLDIFKIFSHIPMLDVITNICAFEKKKFYEELGDINLNDEMRIDALSRKEKAVLYAAVIKLGNDYFQEQKKYVCTYLRDNGFTGNIAVVDIGWSGTMQQALQRYSKGKDLKLRGYYMGTRNVKEDVCYIGLSRDGYLFDHERNQQYDLMLRFTAGILEMMCSSMEGSVLRYDIVEGRIVPILAEPEYVGEEKEFINTVQTAAKDFLYEIRNDELLMNGDNISADIVMDAYSRFAVTPNLSTLNLFENFYFLNAETRKLLPEYNVFYYLFHTNKLNRDFRENPCKIFFLKHLFKIRMPYFRFLKWLFLISNKEK